MKPKTINLKIQSKVVKGESFKTPFTLIVDEPIYDCSDKAAEHFGMTRDEYRRIMNTEEGYQELLELDE